MMESAHSKRFFLALLLLFTLLVNSISPVLASTYYPHVNHQGSVVAITNENGEVVSSNSYYPYGNDLSQEGDQGIQERGYTGQKKDSEVDIYYYNARYYDPDLSTFLSADSKMGGSRYTYVLGNPIIFVDPTGQKPAEYLVDGGGSGYDHRTVNVLVSIYAKWANKGQVEERKSFIQDIANHMAESLGINYNLEYQLIYEIPMISQKEGLSSGFPVQYDPLRTWHYEQNFDYEAYYDENNLSSGKYDEAWVLAGPNSNTVESTAVGENLIPIMGLNTSRMELGCGLEAFGHRFEYANWSRVDFWAYTGNLLYYRVRNREPYPLTGGLLDQIPVGSLGIGNVHNPPNTLPGEQYYYDSPRTAIIPGYGFSDCSLWGCTHSGYMDWWLDMVGQNDKWLSRFLDPK